MGTDIVPPQGQKGLKSWVTGVVVFLLWLATAALGLVVVGLSREIAWGIYATFSTDAALMGVLGQGILVFMAILWLIYVIGSAEYHWKHAGKQNSWNVLIWAVALELLFLILYFVVAV
jgi:hypothetical protein